MSDDEVRQLGKLLDVELVSAPWDEEHSGLYRALAAYPREDGWVTLRYPVLFGDLMVIPVARARRD